jgi:hypothetical protein
MNLLRCLASKPGQDGFALPIAMGFGLIVLVLGASTIVRSQSDRVTSIAQRSTGQSLNAAEIGVARFQERLQLHRASARYPACVNWQPGTDLQPVTSDDICADTGSTASWFSPANIPDLNITCNGADGYSTLPAIATRAWQNIDASDARRGQYRLIDYTYNPTTQQGTLVVEGRVNPDNSDNMGTTRLSVQIPVRSVQGIVPGLWVKDSVNTQTIQANIVGSCTGAITASPDTGYSVSQSGQVMPDPPAKPTSAIVDLGASMPSDLTLPRDTDTPNAEGVYQYSVGSINESFTITPGEKVSIWLEGDLDLQGEQKAIQHQCGTTANCSPFDARIYGLSSNGTLNLGGNPAICDVFFHGSNYTVSLNGGGQAQGCGGGANNNGIYWVKSWSGGGEGNHIALNQTNATWEKAPIQPPPTIAPINTWERQQVN